MKYGLMIPGIFLALSLQAQKDTGMVTVHKDSRLAMLVKKQVQINDETTRGSRRSMPGFRIQISNSTDRNNALEAKTRVYKLYPELKAYLQYQSPYYRVKVGNFKTRQEAEGYLRDLAKDFSANIFIVRDTIEVKPETDTTSDLQ
ncbi:MAG: SPOR domain-containing protein [Chitinophagaceae bacterium]